MYLRKTMKKVTKEEVLELLKNKGLTLGSVESLTGGLFSSTFVETPGASAVFKGALVTYSPLIKESVAHVDKNLIEKYGVVSNEVAYAMASNGRKVLDVDVCISFTGNAGPDVLENKPVGDVYIGLATKDGTTVEHCNFRGTRNEIRRECVEKGFELIYFALISKQKANL